MTRVAIVTGAAGALGSAISRVLRDASIDVVGVDITGDADVTADVSTAEGTRAMVAEAVERYGRLDILVLNAGTQHVSPIDEFDADRGTGCRTSCARARSSRSRRRGRI